MLIAFSKSAARGSDVSGKHRLTANDITIEYASIRPLLVSVKSKYINMCVVDLHIPRPSSPDTTPECFQFEAIDDLHRLREHLRISAGKRGMHGEAGMVGQHTQGLCGR